MKTGDHTNIIKWLVKIINSIWSFVGYLYEYRTVYKIGGVFFTRKFKKAENLHKYAVLVAARNEEAVIGQLIDSIKQQDYPEDLIDIFVVADNCTDNTAKVSREAGAICYERFDSEHRTKGYALQYLTRCIKRDYGIEHYEGYFIFDADNLLKQDFVRNMNDSFDAGEKIITSYRNTKNFSDNWIAASYGIHWLRTIRNEHRVRSVLHLATRIQGTGFLFASEVIKDGWNYTGLTEDRAFCADAVANGYKISYNNRAEFYDEQPVDIKIAMRQRIRWAKGHLQALAETGPTLLKHIFVTGGAANKEEKYKNAPWYKKLFNNIRLRFMSFDMLTVVFPRSLGSVIKRWLIYILRVALIFGGALKISSSYGPDILKTILNWLNIPVSNSGHIAAAIWLFFFTIAWIIQGYIEGIFTAVYIFIIEYKRIMYIKWYKKIWYCLTFPIFDQIGKISMCIALFKKVEWKPIPHNAALSIDEITEGRKKQKS